MQQRNFLECGSGEGKSKGERLPVHSRGPINVCWLQWSKFSQEEGSCVRGCWWRNYSKCSRTALWIDGEKEVVVWKEYGQRLTNAFWINWWGEAAGKMAAKGGRGPRQNTVGAHCELSRLHRLKGQMRIVKGGIRASRGGGKEALNMGTLVYSKCLLNNCGVEWRKRCRESSR